MLTASLYWASQHFRSAVWEETWSNCINSTAESTLYAGWNLWSTATLFHKQDQLVVLGDTGEDSLAKPRPNVSSELTSSLTESSTSGTPCLLINLYNLLFVSYLMSRLCNFLCSSLIYFAIFAQLATIDGFRVSHLRKLACCSLLLLLLLPKK